MTAELMIATDALYRVAGECVVTAETVWFEPVRSLTLESRSFERAIDDLESDVWRAFLRKLKRSGWDLLNAPLPLSSPVLDLCNVAQQLTAMIEANRHMSDPDLVVRAFALTAMIQELGQCDEDPLGIQCREILATGDLSRSSLLVRETLWRDAVDASWRRGGFRTTVLVPSALAHSAPLETLIVVGQARFYSQSTFDSPRAENIGVVRYGWLFDVDEIPPLLAGSDTPPIPIRHSTSTSALSAGESFEPMIDWATIQEHAGVPGGGNELPDDSDTDLARARLFLLAGYYGVYLEDDESPSVLVINPTADDDQRVSRRQARSLEPGDFILLRKGRGDFEFLEEVANQILGSGAKSLRAEQARWKDRLRAIVQARGALDVARDLAGLGASVQNVRYWMSPDSIRTRHRADFEVLMEFVGLGTESDAIWTQMGRIGAAHRVAGFRIRRQLLDLVRTIDLQKMIIDGMIDVELAVDDAGVLTIFRIEAKSPEHAFISRRDVRIPFPVERDLWLG